MTNKEKLIEDRAVLKAQQSADIKAFREALLYDAEPEIIVTGEKREVIYWKISTEFMKEIEKLEAQNAK